MRNLNQPSLDGTDQSILSSGEISDTHPKDDQWRGDGLAGSPHTRLVDQIRVPLDDHDPERAAEICAAICRQALLDFAPAIVLVPPDDRPRVQALTAYVLTLFDFAKQPGLEGERLSGLNRWQFELEESLDGKPRGQPVFVALALANQESPWEREGFDRLHRLATHIAVVETTSQEHLCEELAAAWLKLLLGRQPSDSIVTQAGALVRTHRLVGSVGNDSRQAPPKPDKHEDERSRLIAALSKRFEPNGLPKEYRPAAAYLRLAALRLLGKSNLLQGMRPRKRPQLGLVERLTILGRARWLGR